MTDLVDGILDHSAKVQADKVKTGRISGAPKNESRLKRAEDHRSHGKSSVRSKKLRSTPAYGKKKATARHKTTTKTR